MINVKLIKAFVLVFMTSVFATNVSADLGGKKVILIHGFDPFQLIFSPQDNGKADSVTYWDGASNDLKTDTAGLSNIIYWPSTKRLMGSDGIISIVQPQIAALLEAGHCDDQCVIVTHSTGDLVSRYLLKNKTSLFGSLAGRFKVAAVVDLAGAGGGTELANFGVGIANGIDYATKVASGIFAFAGFNIEPGLNVGVMTDLQTSVARNHATGGFPSIPHLRVAGTGDEFYGFATHLLIKGSDDSVVPLHSACGSHKANYYESCSRDLRISGKVAYEYYAPKFSDLYDYHYPLVMSESLQHNHMQGGKTGNQMTFIESVANQYNGGSAATVGLHFQTKNVYEWWDFFSKYRYIKNAKSRSITQVLADSIN